MSRLQALLEQEDTKVFLEKNQDAILEMGQDVHEFGEIIKEYVHTNSDEFLGQNLDETYKNIRIFSEFATAQYVTELVGVNGQELIESEFNSTNSDALSEYL